MKLSFACSRATGALKPHGACHAAVDARQCARLRWMACPAAAPGRRQQRAAAAAAPEGASSSEPEEEVEGLLPEEDAQIPGTYRDAMSSNTQLGKAVKGACDELDALGGLERQTLEQAENLLKQLGFKGSLFTAPQQQQEPDSE